MTRPAPGDLELGLGLARKFVEAGQGRVRRVSMIGSRARGDATPHSDLDVVVVVELPRGARPWGTADAHAERRRLQETAGPPPVRTDLWVCTTDLFEEGRHMVGGVESLVEVEGVELYHREFDRPPVVRRSPDEVRRANVRSWLEQGLTAYEGAVRLDESLPSSIRGVVTSPAAAAAAWKSARATINALLVAHGVRTAKHDPLHRVLEKLAVHEPSIAIWLRAALSGDACSPATARSILEVALRRLGEASGMAPLVAPVQVRLAASRLLLTPVDVQVR